MRPLPPKNLLLALAVVLATAGAARADQPEEGTFAPPASAKPSADGPQRLILALDGIPFDLFREAQAEGLFRDFRPPARMVSTFPSLSDVAFSAIGGTEPPEGYQVMRFDREHDKVVGNTLGSLSGEAHQHLPADSRTHSAWHRMIGYVMPYRMALSDLQKVKTDVLASRKATFTAYIEDTDMLMHVHGHDKGLQLLRRLDGILAELSAEVKQRTGRTLAIDIVSDHGSTMQKGRIVPIEGALEDCGFQRGKHLDDEDDIAMSYAGIIGSVAISCAPKEARSVAACLAAQQGVELAAFADGDAVVVLAGKDEARIRLASASPETYTVRLIHGNPLGLGALVGVAAGEPRPAERTLDAATLFAASADAAHPDPVRRIWRAFHGAVKEPTEVLVSLGDGWEAGNKTVRALAQVRGRSGTHGSLTRLSSLGVLASNWRDVRDCDAWSAHAVLFSDDTRRAAAEWAPEPQPVSGE